MKSITFHKPGITLIASILLILITLIPLSNSCLAQNRSALLYYSSSVSNPTTTINTTSLFSQGISLIDRYHPYLAVGTGLLLFGYDHEVREQVLENGVPRRKDAQFFNRFEPWGTARPYLFVVPAFLVHGLVSQDKHSFTVGAEIAVGLAATVAITRGVKTLFGRQRPSQTSEPEDFFHAGRAFYSGHTATAFTFATILAKNYPRQNLAFLGIDQGVPLVPILSYSLATMVGLQRVYSNVHWSSDVYVGAIAGYLLGSLTVKLGNQLGTIQVIPGQTPQIGASFYLN